MRVWISASATVPARLCLFRLAVYANATVYIDVARTYGGFVTCMHSWGVDCVC